MVGCAAAGIAYALCPGVLEHYLSVLVVNIGDGGSFGGEIVEEELLATQILGKGAVVVKMVVGKVGEYAYFELQAGDSFLLHAY